MDIAIIAIAYNREQSLQRLLTSLNAARYPEKDVTLIISIDKSDTDIVERAADAFVWKHGTKRVKKHEQNLGLLRHIMSQGEELDRYDAVIILEDDIVVSPAFYDFVEQCVAKYHDNDDIAGISLYNFPLNYMTELPFEPEKDGHDVFMMNTAQSWGEVWMRRQWRDFHSWYEQNTEFCPDDAVPPTLFSWTRSWLKYHTRYCIEKNRYFIYPYYSFSTNCGEAGTHSARAQAHYQTVLQMAIEGPLRLPDTPAQAVCYDAFFENKALYDALGLTEETCCLDISGLRTPLEGQRFVLSTRSLPYKIVRSFGRMLRPVEMNVIENVPGNAIFLYDRLSPVLRIRNARSDSFLYHYRINDMLSVMRGYGPGRLVRDAFSRLIGKITRN